MVALGVLLFLVRSTNMFNAMKYVGHCSEPGCMIFISLHLFEAPQYKLFQSQVVFYQYPLTACMRNAIL